MPDILRWAATLRREWTKNDGKPREAWAPGRDLKELVLIGVLVLLAVAQAAMFVVTWLR